MKDLDIGSRARVRPAIVAGEISDKCFDPKTGAKRLLLTWEAGDGATHERWFDPAELEADPAPTAV